SFWASWCPYCARQNPYIQKLHEQVKDSDMQAVTVSIDKDLKAASDYMAKHNYTFTAAKFTPALKAVFGEIKVIPSVYVIDKNSMIQESIPGEMGEEDVLDMRKYAKWTLRKGDKYGEPKRISPDSGNRFCGRLCLSKRRAGSWK